LISPPFLAKHHFNLTQSSHEVLAANMDVDGDDIDNEEVCPRPAVLWLYSSTV
jgi:hypothetical protein